MNRPIKINVISIFYPPEMGAAPLRIYSMVQELKVRGADVEVITAMPNYPRGEVFEGYRGKFLVKEVADGIPLRRYWLYASNSKKALPRIISMFSFSFTIFFAFFYLIRRRPDVVIINSPPLLTGFSAVILSKLARRKVVTNISDIWPMSALELGAIKRGRFYSFLEKVENFIYRRSDACMAQSQETLDHITTRQADKSSFLYMNLMRRSPFISRSIPYESGNLKIVYAGLLGLAQGVFKICQNIDFKELGVELHIYGNGNEKAAIVEYIEQNPDCNIILHEVIPKSEVPEMLSHYHATLIPLATPIYGAFPSKVYMAVAAGMPVFFSGEGGGAKTVKEHNLGWVTPSGDFEALSGAIQEFAEMGASNFQKLRQNCTEAATNFFDFDKQNDALFKYIHEVANLETPVTKQTTEKTIVSQEKATTY